MRTLIKAFDCEDKGTPQSIFLFLCVHDVPAEALVASMGAAFRDWYIKTKEGRLYVDENGINWGDACYIPDGFLKKHGINVYQQVVKGVQVEWDEELVVDHNDSLFDLGEADDLLPDTLADEVEGEEE